MKTFKSAGVSRLNGKMTFRATNRETEVYIEILKKDGHTDVHLVKLNSEMTKEDARKNLLSRKGFEAAEIQACLRQVEKEDKKQAKASKTKITKPVQSKKPPAKKAAAKPKTKSKAKDIAANADVPNAERGLDDDVDVGEELGMKPAFTKHLDEETH